MKGKIIPKEIKDEILEKVHRGKKVADLTKTYGLGQKTIYSWMSKTVNSSMSSLAISGLKRENEALKVLVGELSLQVSKRGKKAGITKMLNKSEKQIKLCEKNKIIVSMSDKAKPGHNAHQESFFSHIKLEFGDFERFDTLGELFAEISQMI